MTTETTLQAGETREVVRFSVSLDLEEAYRFSGDFGLPGVAKMTLDEAPPLGGGAGPNPARVLALAVSNCLSSSLLFCLRKARIEVGAMRATADGEMARNERGRLRVSRIDVTLSPHVAAEDEPRTRRCIEIFEDFCPVTAVVRQGLEVNVTVTPVTGG
jgi:organic hydroperoxide reductase OsmC/OhrA